MVSLLDVTPTVLDWFGIPAKQCSPLSVNHGCLPGRSMMSVLESEPHPGSGWDEVYASQSLHEITMYYPMRAIRTRQHRLIHNMAYKMPFPIDQDFYASPSFQDLLERTRDHHSLDWFTDLHHYYYRPAWELYDIVTDPHELKNIANDSAMSGVLWTLQQRLLAWQNATRDPWICGPCKVIVRVRDEHDRCSPLYNELDDCWLLRCGTSRDRCIAVPSAHFKSKCILWSLQVAVNNLSLRNHMQPPSIIEWWAFDIGCTVLW